MRLIYIAHPYEGKQTNADKVERLIKGLVRSGDPNAYLSQIHNTGFLYDEISYREGIDICLEMLSRCDELWLCGDWWTSRGCLAEYAFAKARGIEILEITGATYNKLIDE